MLPRNGLALGVRISLEMESVRTPKETPKVNIHANSLKNLRAPWQKGQSGNPGGRPNSRKQQKSRRVPPKKMASPTDHFFADGCADFERVLAEVENMNIFAGPNADFWNCVIAIVECRVRERPRGIPLPANRD